MIFAFAALLNSLTFPIQILIRTKRLDISNYLLRVQAAKGQTHNEGLLAQIEKYERFIQDLVSKNQVLDKRFYVVIPYIGLDLSQVTSSLTGLFGRRPQKLGKWTVLEKAKVNLEPKIEHLTKQFGRVGVKAVRLNTEELVELFYDLYNPEIAKEEKAAIGPREYATPIVEPSLSPEPVQDGEEQPDLAEQPEQTQTNRPMVPQEQAQAISQEPEQDLAQEQDKTTLEQE